jgi:F420-dependent oxidoreductase-like protein
MIGYSGARIELPMDLILEAERLGFYAVWTSEAWGSDAVTPLAWAGALTRTIRLGTAIMQIPARTPTNTAMTAMTLDQLSGGRFLLGLGVSGPQVVEGWHGQSFGKPLERTREYVSILRAIFQRQQPLTFTGYHYQIPYQGEDRTGLGKPLKITLQRNPNIPIYLAAIGPKNVELAAEIADGWLPIFFAPRHYVNVFQNAIENGFRSAGVQKGYDNFDIAPAVPVMVGDDLEACRNAIKPMLALYIGGMGARGKNFYYDLAVRYGYQPAATKIQELYLAGNRLEAVAAVPDELVDEVALCGPKERIRDQLLIWKDCPVATLNLLISDLAGLRTIAELIIFNR